MGSRKTTCREVGECNIALLLFTTLSNVHNGFSDVFNVANITSNIISIRRGTLWYDWATGKLDESCLRPVTFLSLYSARDQFLSECLKVVICTSEVYLTRTLASGDRVNSG